jgi:hypothetical protein
MTGVALVAFAAFFALVGVLVRAYRKLRDAAELEDAEAVLRAELDEDRRSEGGAR